MESRSGKSSQLFGNSRGGGLPDPHIFPGAALPHLGSPSAASLCRFASIAAAPPATSPLHLLPLHISAPNPSQPHLHFWQLLPTRRSSRCLSSCCARAVRAACSPVLVHCMLASSSWARNNSIGAPHGACGAAAAQVGGPQLFCTFFLLFFFFLSKVKLHIFSFSIFFSKQSCIHKLGT